MHVRDILCFVQCDEAHRLYVLAEHPFSYDQHHVFCMGKDRMKFWRGVSEGILLIGQNMKARYP